MNIVISSVFWCSLILMNFMVAPWANILTIVSYDLMVILRPFSLLAPTILLSILKKKSISGGDVFLENLARIKNLPPHQQRESNIKHTLPITAEVVVWYGPRSKLLVYGGRTDHSVLISLSGRWHKGEPLVCANMGDCVFAKWDMGIWGERSPAQLSQSHTLTAKLCLAYFHLNPSVLIIVLFI